jgi:SAM-dependent methyltransferase
VKDEADATWDAGYVAQYLQVYAQKHTPELSAAQARAAVALAGTPAGGAVLDCPCGNGRHSLPLAVAGYKVTGADSSTSMLAVARHNCAARSATPAWVVADYRRLPFRAASFDTVLNLFTSFGFYGDRGDAGVLQELRRVLKPSGRLLIETTHRDRLVRDPQDGAARFDIRGGWLHMTHLDGLGRPAATSRIRVYTVTELERMVESAGFRDIEIYGDLDGVEATPDTRLVLIALR